MVGASALSGGFWLSSTNSDPVLLFQAIESAIGGNAYQHSKVNQWTTNVVEQTLSQLTKLGKPFKYIGNAFLLLVYIAGGCWHAGERRVWRCDVWPQRKHPVGAGHCIVCVATLLACSAAQTVAGRTSQHFPALQIRCFYNRHVVRDRDGCDLSLSQGQSTPIAVSPNTSHGFFIHMLKVG